jgi:hypothetical protein
MSAGEDENLSPQESGQLDPFFITEYVEAELIATGYEFEPPNHVRCSPVPRPDVRLFDAVAQDPTTHPTVKESLSVGPEHAEGRSHKTHRRCAQASPGSAEAPTSPQSSVAGRFRVRGGW